MPATLTRTLARWFVGASLLMGLGTASAVDVALTGSLGKRALLVIGGQARTVAVGATVDGVRLIELAGDRAVVEVAGQRRELRLGEAPVSLSSTPDGGGSQIVLSANSGGHFVTSGRINNRDVRFLVDTGATAVGLGVAQAERIGLNYRRGQPVQVSTANGTVQGYVVNLDSVRIGDVEVYNVVGVVTPVDMPYILLGNSFLGRFQMRRDNEMLTLTRRY